MGATSREHGKNFMHLVGANFRKFFSRVGIYAGGHFLKVRNPSERIAAWKALVKRVRKEEDLTPEALAALLGRSPDEVRTVASRNTVEPPFGFVLDFCFLFQIDPLEIYPELVWLREIWMQDFKVNIEATKRALDEGNPLVTRECLDALERGAARWESPEVEHVAHKILMVTKAHYTERYAYLRWHNKAKWLENRPYFFEQEEVINAELEKELAERRALYEQITSQVKQQRGQPKKLQSPRPKTTNKHGAD